MKITKIFLIFFLYFSVVNFVFAGVLESDLNENGIWDSQEEEVVVSASALLPAGEYNFKNLIITNSAELKLGRDEYSPELFKGVKINAVNLIIDEGGVVSADGRNTYGTNYGQGVPPPEMYQIGAGYGGSASNSFVGTYGSAIKPIDLGSDGYFKGGGAIWFSISNLLTNNGVVSASGGLSASGGSIYVVAKQVTGNGAFRANGGGLFVGGYYKSPGGGGRVAVHFDDSSFIGIAEAKGGCGSYSWPIMSCSGNGTVGLFDKTTNNLLVGSSWRFQKNDSPFVFNKIFVNNAKIENEEEVNVSASELLLDNQSSIIFSKNQKINIRKIVLNNWSTIIFSGQEVLVADTLALNDFSSITVLPENKLNLKIPNINVSAGSSISVDGKGYGINSGPGAPTEYRAGASYGGLGSGNGLESIYGSETEPVDFGSGGDGYHPSGGGALKIESDNLVNNGLISANGLNNSSGGSVYVITKKLSGVGFFQANGGEAYCPNLCYGPGGGGRIAIYYGENNFTGVIQAKGLSVYGGVSEDGTVYIKQTNSICEECSSNVLFIPGLEASRLYWKGVLSGENENQLWEPNRNADVEKLYLDENGKSIYGGVYTRDIIDETNTPFSMGMAGQNIYKTFSKTMDSLVSDEEINEWRAYAYDWRQGVKNIVENGTEYENDKKSLIEILEELVNSSKNGKVTIIAHSNGGLIAKALLQKLGEDKSVGRNNLIDKVDVLILVAVPQIGTPSAIPAILHGYDQAKLGGLLMKETNARELGRNMISAYGLLPSKEYINNVSFSPITFVDDLIPSGITTPYINYYGTILDSYNEYINFLKGTEGRNQPEISDTLSPIILSEGMLLEAESLHNKIDNWIPPTNLRVIEVAGWGLDTVASFKYKPSEKCVSGDGVGVCQKVLDEVPIFTVDGDKTVVEPSALHMSGVEKYWVDLNRHNGQILGGFRRNREHKDILEVDSVNNLIKSIVQKTNIILDNVLKNTKPIDSENRLRLSVHSPITLGVYDLEGNFTGKVCPEILDFCYVKDEIPNSSYLEFGEGKYLNLPEENMQKVVMQGTGIGTFTFESEKVFPNNTSTSTRFVDIPVTPQTIAEITTNPTTQNYELKMDINNDGILDITIQPNNDFDPIVYLKVMRKTIESLNITKIRKNLLLKRIDDTIKAIEKGKINKAKLKIINLKKIMNINSNLLDKLEDKKWFEKKKDKYLTREEIEQIITMLDTLLNNLNK